MHSRWSRVGGKWLLAVVAALAFSQLWGTTALVGQSPEEPIIGLEVDEDLLAEPFLDPIELFELEDEPLVEVVNYDLTQLHPSEVFEEGIENLAVRDEIEITAETEQHLRAVSAIATAEQALEVAGQDIISEERSIRSAAARIEAAGAEIDGFEEQISDLLDQIDVVNAADDREVAERALLDADIDVHENAIAEFAIQAFIGADDALATIASNPLSLEPVTRKVITDEARESQREAIVVLDGLVDENSDRRSALAQELETAESATRSRRAAVALLKQEISELRTSITDSRSEIDRLEDREVELADIIEEATEFSDVTALRYQLIYHQRLEQFVAGTDLPLVALNAYVRASRSLAVEDPACGIHWSQLAGIGRIESLHGYFGDSTLNINGQTTVPIRGLALDGRVLSGGGSSTPDATGRTQTTNNVSRLALIRDTDNGVLDGDTEFDRAVGPMQFIPTTWALYDDSDGNGDERVDPQNVYDAALAAARYLCDAPGSMLTAEGEQRAYFAYNHDFVYSRNVTVAGRRYHNALSIGPEVSPSFAAYAASGAAEALAAENLGLNDDTECENDETDGENPDAQATEPTATTAPEGEGDEEIVCDEEGEETENQDREEDGQVPAEESAPTTQPPVDATVPQPPVEPGSAPVEEAPDTPPADDQAGINEQPIPEPQTEPSAAEVLGETVQAE